MKQAVMVLMMLAMFAFTGCTGSSADELFETAELEMLQKNHAHAAELYKEILNKHPESKYAQKARERLNAIEKPQN